MLSGGGGSRKGIKSGWVLGETFQKDLFKICIFSHKRLAANSGHRVGTDCSVGSLWVQK